MKSALRERLRQGAVDPTTRKQDGNDALPELVQYAVDRRDVLSRALLATFEAKLDKYEKMAGSDFSGRQVGQRAQPPEKSIFDQSNLSVQLPRNVISFLGARIDKDTFGSRPWLAASPRGKRNQALSSEMQKHGEFKLDEADWRGRARQAMQTTLNLGFCPVKTTWREDWDVTERMASVLFDPQAAQPVVAQNGDFVFDDDNTAEEQQEPVDGAMEEQQEIPGITAQPGRRVFAKDPSIPAPDEVNGFDFREHLIEDRERLFCGLDFSLLSWKDVAWPVNAASMSLDDPGCDFISVTLPMTVEQILATYDPDGDNVELQELAETLRSSSPEQTESTKPKDGEAEVQSSCYTKNPTIKITECYFRRRVLPEGPESRIFLVIAEGRKQAVYCEYLKHISPRAQAPLHLISVNRVPGRAYGRGFYEMFEMASEACDKLLNQILVRNEYHSNPTKFIDAKAEAQLVNGAMLTGPGKWVTVEAKGQPIASLFHVLGLPDMDERTWELFQFFMQLIQTESGVTNANQGDVSDLPSNTTATGINSMLESSSVIHLWHLESIRSGLTPPLRYALELIYFRQDSDEAYELLEGDAQALEALTEAQGIVNGKQAGVMTYAQAKELANIPLNVEILLSRAKRQELREAAFAAIPQVQAFYQLPPEVQLKMLPLYIQAMKGLDIDDPAQFFPTIDELKAQIAKMEAQPPDDSANRISLREQMNYADVPPSVQRQMEAAAGFAPATPEENAAQVKAYAGQAEEQQEEEQGPGEPGTQEPQQEAAA